MGFSQAGPESATIAWTRLRDDTGPAVFGNRSRTVCTVIVDNQDFPDLIEAVVNGGQVALSLSDGKGDVSFFVQTRHKDSKVEPVHSHYLLEFELCQQNPSIFAS